MSSLPALLVSRRLRQIGTDWTNARSWLGGAPRIGSLPWPRDESGEPLHFYAQIDLAEVAAKTAATALPREGSLAFFVGREGAVLYVPAGQGNTAVLPPPGTPELTKFGASEDWPTDLEGRPLFPYWPIDFTTLNIPVCFPGNDADDGYDDAHDAFIAARTAAVEEHFPRKETFFSAQTIFAGPPIPDWWQNAIQLANDLADASRYGTGPLRRWRLMLEQARSKGGKELSDAEASVARCEAQLDEHHRAQPAFKDFFAEVAAWTAGRDPWALMDPRDRETLKYRAR